MRKAAFRRTAGVSDPEAKRKIIGKMFVDVFDDESKKTHQRENGWQ